MEEPILRPSTVQETLASISSPTLEVSNHGETIYQLVEESRDQSLFIASISNEESKGLGIISRKPLPKSTIPLINYSIATLVTGDNRKNVCACCYKYINKSIKYSKYCEYSGYCSYECLECHEHFYSTCAKFLPMIESYDPDSIKGLPLTFDKPMKKSSNTSSSTSNPCPPAQESSSHPPCPPENDDDDDIPSPTCASSTHPSQFKMINNIRNSMIETQLIILKLLYELVYSEDSKLITQILQFLQLYDVIEPQDDWVYNTIQFFYNGFIENQSAWIEKINVYETFTIDLIYKLFRIIRINTFNIPCPGMSKIVFVCLLPTISRVNHNCIPNCTLTLDIETKPEESPFGTNFYLQTQSNGNNHCRQVKISLLVINDIPANQELTINYIDNLCANVHERKNLLKQGFFFDCQCAKCAFESSYANVSFVRKIDNHNHNKPSSSSSSSSSSTQNNNNNYLLTEEIKPITESILLHQENLTKLIQIPRRMDDMHFLVLEDCELFLNPVEKCLQLIKSLSNIIGKMNRSDNPLINYELIYSPSDMYFLCLYIIEDYQRRFKALEGNWKEYIRFGMIFVKAGLCMKECWTLAGSSSLKIRFDMMTTTAVYCSMLVKVYLTHGKTLFPPKYLVQLTKECLGMMIELGLIIDSVYLNDDATRERESDLGLEATNALCDSWHTFRIMRDKVQRMRIFLKSALEKLSQLQDMAAAAAASSSSSSASVGSNGSN